MIVTRKKEWGTLEYDTLGHRFSCVKTNGKKAVPYADQPVVLNCDLTLKCNMNCRHCVSKDFEVGVVEEDLTISKQTIDWINTSHFMVVVITGGEPFLKEYQEKLIVLLQGIKRKGLIVDTNGTIAPAASLINTIRKTRTLVRISWDSPRPQDEACLRQKKLTNRDDDVVNLDYYRKKIAMITWLRKHDIHIAVQSVIHKRNIHSILQMPAKLREYSVRKWYLQRFIPSYLEAHNEGLRIDMRRYTRTLARLIRRCDQERIECITKREKRHNSVFLLVGDGFLYTQGEKPREKLLLGNIGSNISYFDYVSAPDHSDRYYGGGETIRES